jgi:hypothetical protein
MSPELLELIMGPFGALVVLSLGMGALTLGKLIAPWWALEREMKRTERWEDIAGKAIETTTVIFSQTSKALQNHERILANQQTALELLRAIRQEQGFAKEREDWEQRS